MMDLVGKKHRKHLASTLNENAAAPPSRFAHAQLEKMGWSQGTGLGKNRDGMVSHIKVKKREDGAGLGIEQHTRDVQAAQQDWWKNSLSSTLSKLSSKKKSSDGEGKKSQKRPREYTDQELFEATGGVRFGMRAGKTRNLHKWKRTESMETTGTAVVSAEEEVETPEQRAERKRLKKERKEAKRLKKERKEAKKERKMKE